MTALQASTSSSSVGISSLVSPPWRFHRHQSFVVPARVVPTEKSARKPGTFFCVDKGVTSVVIKGHCGPIYATPVGRNHQNTAFDNGNIEEPLFIQYIKQGISAIKMVFGFLVEQPGQLKYIEWPSFGSTLKTSTLTLILVALLIVALSTVDSALAFLLALILRKKA